MSSIRDRYTLACLQTRPEFGAVPENLDHVEALISGLECDVLVLPELFNTGYCFRDRGELRAYAETFPGGETVTRMRGWSRALDCVIVGGFAECDGDRLYNAAAVVAAGEPLSCYRKIHLFGFEHESFDAGNRPFPVVEHEGLRVGTMICFDWIYPEAARLLALEGADVIAHPSNLVLPGLCQQAMCVRALENRVYTATANRFGTEHRAPRDAVTFTGASRIVSPLGDVLADAPVNEDALLCVAVDPMQTRSKRVASGNDIFAERRPEWYGGLTASP